MEDYEKQCYEQGYHEGWYTATQKAVNWLREHLPEYWQNINANDTKEFLEQLKKAMER